MRYHVHSLLTTIAVMMLATVSSFAQTSERFRENGAFAPRAEVAQIGSYGNLQPAISTGAMKMDIPLLTYGADASSPVLSQSYAYSIQGWMKRNSVWASYGNIFDESLARDSEGRDALFSGRIRSAEYRHLDDLQMREEYCYDHLGRLTGSMHFEDGHILRRGIESDIRYDANGNITSLVRFNEREEAEPRRFDYYGNRRVEYQYDRNGNIRSFGNVNILNLPYEQGLNTYK